MFLRRAVGTPGPDTPDTPDTLGVDTAALLAACVGPADAAGACCSSVGMLAVLLAGDGSDGAGLAETAGAVLERVACGPAVAEVLRDEDAVVDCVRCLAALARGAAGRRVLAAHGLLGPRLAVPVVGALATVSPASAHVALVALEGAVRSREACDALRAGGLAAALAVPGSSDVARRLNRIADSVRFAM